MRFASTKRSKIKSTTHRCTGSKAPARGSQACMHCERLCGRLRSWGFGAELELFSLSNEQRLCAKDTQPPVCHAPHQHTGNGKACILLGYASRAREDSTTADKKSTSQANAHHHARFPYSQGCRGRRDSRRHGRQRRGSGGAVGIRTTSLRKRQLPTDPGGSARTQKCHEKHSNSLHGEHSAVAMRTAREAKVNKPSLWQSEKAATKGKANDSWSRMQDPNLTRLF
jgi:hypothetical protein